MQTSLRDQAPSDVKSGSFFNVSGLNNKDTPTARCNRVAIITAAAAGSRQQQPRGGLSTIKKGSDHSCFWSLWRGRDLVQSKMDLLFFITLLCNDFTM